MHSDIIHLLVIEQFVEFGLQIHFSGLLCWPGVLNTDPTVWLDRARQSSLVLFVLLLPENKFGGSHKFDELGTYTFITLTGWQMYRAGNLMLELWLPPGRSNLFGNTYWGGRLSTVDLLSKAACSVNTVNNIFYTKRSSSKLVIAKRSTVLNLPFQ